MLEKEITQRLAAADRSHQRQVGATFLVRTAKYLLAVAVLFFGLDAVLHLEAPIRIALDLGYLALLLLAGACAYYIAQVRRNQPERTARLLESRDATLGSRLINLLQLRRQVDSSELPELTRSLARQAVETYEAELSQRDFTPLTKSPELPRHVRRAGIGFLSFAALLAVLYPISKTEFARFLDPLGDHPPYSWTQIEIAEPDEETTVDYNGNIVIKAKTSGHTPSDLFLSFRKSEDDASGAAPFTTLPMYRKPDVGFYQSIEQIRSDITLFVHTKNGKSLSKKRHIKVGLIPKIEKAFLKITPPAYTGITAKEREFRFKEITALHGSKVEFRFQSNRPLASGVITPAQGTALALTPSAENEVGGSITAEESTRLQFALVDPLGNTSQETAAAPLTVTFDLPPAISIESPAQDGFICDDFKIEARISASDDYGIRTIRIHRALNETFSPPLRIPFEEITRNASTTVDFDVKSLGVQPGDTLSLFAEAIDTAPEPHLARTRTLRLMVISTEEYNDYLRERNDISAIQHKYSSLLNEFHDRIDEQKELSEAIRKLEEKRSDPKTPMDEKELRQELDKLMAQQAEVNKKLEKLAGQMENFVREKPLYDLESELQHNLTEKASTIRDSLKENDGALKANLENLAKNSEASLPEQLNALASLGEESQKQIDALAPAQQQAAEEILPPIRDAALMNALLNDFNAIKYLHEVQSNVADEAKAFGNRPNMSDEDKLALRQLAGTEKKIEQALDKVVANLRNHAEAASETFPKASESARDLAAKIEGQRLSHIADQTARTMLASKGADSWHLAERLRQELSELFETDDSADGGSMCKEFDKYLKLTRRMNSGNTFAQMARSRKFGMGKGMGANPGNEGSFGEGIDGYSTSSMPNFSLFGGETLGGDDTASGDGQFGRDGASATARKADLDKADTLPAPETANRQTDETRSELPIDEYRGVIDAYFDSIIQ